MDDQLVNIDTVEELPLSLPIGRMIALLVHYFIGYLFVYRMIATRVTLAIQPDALIIAPFMQIAIYVFTLVVAAWLAWPVIQDSWQKFKAHKKEELLLSGSLIVIMIVVNMALSMLVSILTHTGNSTNQEEIRTATTMIPLLTVLATCVFSPLIEEFVFRAGVFSCLRGHANFIISALVSSVLFGSIHIMDSLFAGDFVDVSYLLVYAGIGFILAYGYEKSHSCMVPLVVHTANNILSIILMFL